MKVREKYKSIKDSLRKLHINRNVMDNNEYNIKIKEIETSINQSPNKLDEMARLEMSILNPMSCSAIRTKQVVFRSKSKDNEADNAK